MFRCFRLFLCCVLSLEGLSFGGSLAQALESAPIVTPHAKVTLVSRVDAVDSSKPFRLGLHFKLAKGWHIYWSNPGVAGEPPTLELDLPKGAKATPIAWPVPSRAQEGPAMTYSYFDDVLLPVTVTPVSTASSFPISAKASWLICEKICVPESGSFSLNLPIGKATGSADAPLFKATDERMPGPSPFAATLSADGVLSLAGRSLSPESVHNAWFLPASWGEIDDLAPQLLSVADGKLSLALKPGQTFDPEAGLSGVVVLQDNAGHERAFTIAASLQAKGPAASSGAASSAASSSAAPSSDASSSADPGLFASLAFAFFGGLILNLMPCVFPILAMKALSLARLSGYAEGKVRTHAASYTLGVLFAFALLAGLSLALRAAGTSVGWGFQFQSPIFVTMTAWLLFIIGLNLSGVFEFNGTFTQIGDGLTRLDGHTGSFFTGLLAVLVATPCTAPFMGVAVAVAATAAPATTLLIFLFIGLGLAAPYGLLAIVPQAAALLPRPGRWMLVLREALAFPMYGAAIWLVWVVAEESGADGLLVILSGALLIGFALWLLQATRDNEGRGRAFGRAGAIMAVIGAFVLLINLGTVPQPFATTAKATENEMPYSASRLASLRAEGRPAFIDMTAAWCVTCLVNERVALSSQAVVQAFAKHKIAYLKGDWTRADPEITRFLQEHHRDGVPLYVYYPPKGRPPVVLPQILTASMVLDEINRFGG
jgi:thiol:disulfide interchange protein/DsbC/DsbD-like thiol-disulfide interchange protein